MKEGSDSVSASRFRTVAARIAFDLGGRENLTEAQLQVIRRAAMLAAQCELLEAQALDGKDFNAIAYGQLTGHLVRALNVLGLKREMLDVTPALHQYLDMLPAEPPDIEPRADDAGEP